MPAISPGPVALGPRPLDKFGAGDCPRRRSALPVSWFGLQLPRFTWTGRSGRHSRRGCGRSPPPPRTAGFEQPLGDGPLPPDPRDGPPVGGHARELDDPRLPRPASPRPSGSARSSRVSRIGTSPTSARSSPRSTSCPAAGRCAGSALAWFQQEHAAYGWEFPRSERYALLEDALQLLRSSGDRHARLHRTGDQCAGGDVLPAAPTGADPDARRRVG